MGIAAAVVRRLKREAASRGVVRVAADLKIVAGSRDAKVAADTKIVAGPRDVKVAADTKIVAGSRDVRVAADTKIVAGSRGVKGAVATKIAAGSRDVKGAVATKIVAGLKAALAIGRVTRDLAARRGGMIALDVNSTVGRVAGRAVSSGGRRRARAALEVTVAREASTVVSNPGVTVLGVLGARADTRVVDAGRVLEVVVARVGRAAASSLMGVRRVGGSRKHLGTNSANLG